MAATINIPVYLTLGTGSTTEIGTIEIEANAEGTFTLTAFDVTAALRKTADAMDAAAKEAEDAAP